VVSLAELTNEERIHRAQEAARLIKEPLCVEVLEEIRSNALETLACIDPDLKLEITRLQATIAVVDDFRDGLGSIVLNADGLSEESGPS
jgi:hypothetical protein